MPHPYILLLLAACLSFQSFAEEKNKTTPTIIPKPEQMKVNQGSFVIDKQTLLLTSSGDAELIRIAGFFADHLRLAGGPDITPREICKADKNSSAIILTLSNEKTDGSSEGYELKVTSKKIYIQAENGAGLFYGIQTLLQLLPAEICQAGVASADKQWEVPCVEIIDNPRYSYRGMHLDVSRHFFPVDFVKRYIDLIAMYKMNRFHWHLTDDNGWRIEIKKYPKLMQIAAWHVDHENLPWNDRPPQQPGEKATYGGYYSQDNIREIVKYAADRYVTIIPEIEMPAHSVEVLAAYPQFSCTGGPFTVPTGSYWPNLDIFCAGNDSVFTFLEDVLTEVMALFPSKYIHVGGDEADKTNWKKCPKCQARIQAENLKDEKELQSYFIKRMEKFIVSKERKMIGWDEILEGGLAPEATVMSWRGVEGGIAAAKQGHDAIMTPGSYCYFDHYQANPASEPKAIGGFTTLKKVYSYDPTPGELTPQEAKHILGAQANLWTEFIPTPSHAEYMALPRMMALAEVVWSPKKERDWNDFRLRIEDQFKRLDLMKINYSKGSFKADINTSFDFKDNAIKVVISSEQLNIPIHYTLNGNDPDTSSNLYTEPFMINKNAYLKAGLFKNGKLQEKITEMPIIFHNAIGKPVKYLQPYSYRYPASGDGALTDGLRGSTSHRDGLWQGFLGNDMEVIIDLGKEVPIKSVSTTFLQNQRSWIFLPSMVEFSLSPDGKKWHSINEQRNTISQKEEKAIVQPFSQAFRKTTTARYIKIIAHNIGICPTWHEGSGESCWMFLDEIVVY